MDLYALAKPLLAGAARHVMTAVAGVLIAQGAITTDQQAQFVTIASGIAVWAAGYAWSAWQKKQTLTPAPAKTGVPY